MVSGQAGAVVADRPDPRVLEQAHAGVQAGLAQTAREPRRVDHRAGVPVPGPAQEGRGVEFAAHPGRVEFGHVVAETAGGPGFLVQVVELPRLRGDGQLPHRREAAVDAAGGDRLADLGQVLRAQLFQQRHLAGETGQAVADAVGKAGGAEAAVSPGRRPPGRVRLDEDDIRGWITLAREQSGPQPGETAADHREVGGEGAGQRGRRDPVRPAGWSRTAAAAPRPARQRRGPSQGPGQPVPSDHRASIQLIAPQSRSSRLNPARHA